MNLDLILGFIGKLNEEKQKFIDEHLDNNKMETLDFIELRNYSDILEKLENLKKVNELREKIEKITKLGLEVESVELNEHSFKISIKE